MPNKKFYTCLWFDGNAKEAADFYCSIFKDSKFLNESPMVVECDTQAEIDYYWDKLGEGGKYDNCGWLTDKYGFSWQIIPSILSDLMADHTKRDRVVQAFLKMQKFDIEVLKNA